MEHEPVLFLRKDNYALNTKFYNNELKFVYSQEIIARKLSKKIFKV